MSEFSRIDCITTHGGGGGAVHNVVLRARTKPKIPWYRFQSQLDKTGDICMTQSVFSTAADARQMAAHLFRELGLPYAPPG
jgi:hypothetical protein